MNNGKSAKNEHEWNETKNMSFALFDRRAANSYCCSKYYSDAKSFWRLRGHILAPFSSIFFSSIHRFLICFDVFSRLKNSKAAENGEKLNGRCRCQEKVWQSEERKSELKRRTNKWWSGGINRPKNIRWSVERAAAAVSMPWRRGRISLCFLWMRLSFVSCETHTMSTLKADIDERFPSTLRWMGEWVSKAAAPTAVENDWNKF